MRASGRPGRREGHMAQTWLAMHDRSPDPGWTTTTSTTTSASASTTTSATSSKKNGLRPLSPPTLPPAQCPLPSPAAPPPPPPPPPLLWPKRATVRLPHAHASPCIRRTSAKTLEPNLYKAIIGTRASPMRSSARPPAMEPITPVTTVTPPKTRSAVSAVLGPPGAPGGKNSALPAQGAGEGAEGGGGRGGCSGYTVKRQTGGTWCGECCCRAAIAYTAPRLMMQRGFRTTTTAFRDCLFASQSASLSGGKGRPATGFPPLRTAPRRTVARAAARLAKRWRAACANATGPRPGLVCHVARTLVAPAMCPHPPRTS